MSQRVGKYNISAKDKLLFDQDASTITSTGDDLTLTGDFTTGTGTSKTTNIGSGGGTQVIGFFGATAVNKPDAIVQSAYTTADRTSDNVTAVAMTDSTGGTAGTTIGNTTGVANNAGVTTNVPTTAEFENAIASLVAEHNKLIIDHANTKQVLNSVVDTLQELGLVG